MAQARLPRCRLAPESLVGAFECCCFPETSPDDSSHPVSGYALLTLLLCAQSASTALPNTLQARAASYMDQRTDWWLGWNRAARGQDTVCLTCHSTLTFALARPLLGKSAAFSRELRNVKKRIEHIRDVEPSYGGDHTSASLGTEAVLSALILAREDARLRGGKPSKLTKQAFEHLWSRQRADGAFDWLSFALKPWEDDAAVYYGAALAAVAAGSVLNHGGTKRQLANLRRFLREGFSAASLHHQLYALWADARLRKVLTKPQKLALIQRILGAQNKTGGWNLADLSTDWEQKMIYPQDKKSDGYATGLSLYVLSQAGLKKEHPQLLAARAWLLKSQGPDGAWPAVYLNRRRNPKGKIGKFMRDASTAFAILALKAP